MQTSSSKITTRIAIVALLVACGVVAAASAFKQAQQPAQQPPRPAIAQFTKMVRDLQPNCLVNGRLGGKGDYRSTGDNRIPDQVVAGVWEVPATINDTWATRAMTNTGNPRARSSSNLWTSRAGEKSPIE